MSNFQMARNSADTSGLKLDWISNWTFWIFCFQRNDAFYQKENKLQNQGSGTKEQPAQMESKLRKNMTKRKGESLNIGGPILLNIIYIII